MTSTELTLFKEMIKECVRDVIKEEIKEQMIEERKSFQKDLMDIKKLVAKNISESRRVYNAKTFKTIPETKKIQPGKVYVNEDVEENSSRSLEDTMEGLYNMFGGKAAYDSMTKASAPLPIEEGKSSNVPVIAKDPLKNILRQTAMQDMTREDIEALQEGMQEAIQEQRSTQQRYVEPVEDVELKNAYVPDFDFNSIAAKRRR